MCQRYVSPLVKRNIDHWLASVENLDAAIKDKLQPSLLCVSAFYADIQDFQGGVVTKFEIWYELSRYPSVTIIMIGLVFTQYTGWAKLSTGKGNKITPIHLHYGRLVLMFIMKLIDLERTT